MREMRGKRSSDGRLNSTKPPKYFLEIANIISKLYPNARKIVEIGVGKSPYTALYLKDLLPKAEIIVTDADRGAVKYALSLNLNSVYDDVNDPNLEIYEGADIIYSIRPPFELIPKLESLRTKIKVDVIIAPLSEDAYLSSLEERWTRINHPQILVYILRA